MKRQAILIGNTRGLAGVPKDMFRTHAFLGSRLGGDWLPAEIEEFTNPRRQDLLAYVNSLKTQSIDYAFVLFSGHGGQKRETVLELNANGESINESELWNIAPRQLTIFDCCRGIVSEEVRKSYTLESFTEAHASRDDLRARYDARIMKAIAQQTRLYACSISQSAYDGGEGKGAIYLGHLLDSASSLGEGAQFKTVELAHEEARRLTMLSAAREGKQQNPDAVLPKCLIEQQLILSIRP